MRHHGRISRRRPTGVNLEVDRSVPKFLQQYAHLLEKGPKKRPRPAVEEGERDDDDEGDAVRAAPLFAPLRIVRGDAYAPLRQTAPRVHCALAA